MNTNRIIARSCAPAAFVFFVSSMVSAYGQTQPDNTKMNKGDQSKTAVTADQQKMNATDRTLTQNIRKSVMADKSLSTYAHNVKIISQNGMVTLKGPVRSEDEKKTVVAKAVEAAGGTDKVVDQLSVKPESK
jgi:hyperosmotically inducible periplasmic protein